ncbi:hypothetical protein BRCON_0088 [Candidatus Sumerlaea chitinivorans]|uniref:Uncharacterized protein n=1 Tax=Sumerlaea chitinivorans TaxID=2250252 RepID=A0A2Z4Y320_SUMC1|nr:hypothetical protein BRCON_0088 [Candidatus Sumerlaea chitinivorans]
MSRRSKELAEFSRSSEFGGAELPEDSATDREARSTPW